MDVGFQGTIDYGGQGRVTIELTRALASLCDQITVYPTALSVQNPTEHNWWTDMPSNINVADKRGLVGSLIRDSVSFRTHDLVHVNYGSLGLPALASHVLTGTPFVYTLHHYDEPSNVTNKFSMKIKYWLDAKIGARLLASMGKFVTISEYNRSRVQKRIGQEPEVIYHGINPKPYRNSFSHNVREKFDLREESDIILFVGKFHGYKDTVTLIRAFNHLLENYSIDTELVLLSGGGPEAPKIRRSINDFNLEEDCTIIPEINDDLLFAFYDEASVFAFPSYGESFGLVYLEAMAAGLPIVCVQGGAASEVVDTAAELVPPGDASTLADKLASVLDNQDVASSLRNRGLKRVEKFTWEKAAQNYLEIYKEAVDNDN
ncbi:glycosyltransferase family 4 protein [Haladaptatus sp. T7]|uniref:glycosyltransferase family 4 protein n=1 Tax=Haladaptatus sp. T7 TaxID=2029368 RepID=UPI0021A25BA3|nr:glycosyltransferase family 4 protein [Haladaptatus sp. T7]GKZ14544.1 hypothetical protein HAL_24250 [Haladaptatus sp. T7]